VAETGRPDDCATDGMVNTDALENHRAANRHVATVEACAAAAESPDAERRRNKAAVIVNAAVLVKQMYNSCTFQS
jgi:hypothetical protein